MTYCKHLKIKLNHTFECKKMKKAITLKSCSDCQFKEYPIKSNLTKLKSRTYKQAKLERNRKSLFTDDLDHCIICKRKREYLHEVFPGKNRTNSMKYNLVLPLCSMHHQLIHSDNDLMTYYKKKGQALFENAYPDLDFIEIFKRNYK